MVFEWFVDAYLYELWSQVIKGKNQKKSKTPNRSIDRTKTGPPEETRSDLKTHLFCAFPQTLDPLMCIEEEGGSTLDGNPNEVKCNYGGSLLGITDACIAINIAPHNAWEAIQLT